MQEGQPLWALRWQDLPLSARASNSVRERLGVSTTKAWHVAALCEACLGRTRNLGRVSLREIRTVLEAAGFPPLLPRCASSELDRIRRGYQGEPTMCERNLQVCRDMLEGTRSP
jgi:hypothetical protein